MSETKCNRNRGLGLAGTLVLLLVATLVQPAGSAHALAAGSDVTVHGWPGGQANLKVWRTNCSDSNVVAADDWEFSAVNGSPDPYGPTAIGWTPTGTSGGYGIEAYYPDATSLDVFQTEVYAPAGSTKGFAEVHYYPAGNVDWYGYSDDGAGADPDFVDDQDGWHTLDASEMEYDWFSLTDDEFDGGLVQDMTIADFTALHGAGTAWARIFLGCDGNPFYVDGFQLGSSVAGWDTYDFEDYRTPNLTLNLVGGRINTCHVSAGAYPQRVTFKGRMSPGGPWEGQQYVGRRNGHWRVVARGNTSGNVKYSAKVYENSYFDLVHPWTVDTRFGDSRDWYIPAFPKIQVRAASTTVRQGKVLRFTGTIKPSKKLTYTPLRAEARGRKWGPFQSMGTRRTDAKGRFSFTIKNPRPGFARINILTKTQKDLTSALTPRAVIYEVLKPKKKKQPVTNNNQPSDPNVDDGEQVDPTPTPQDPPSPFVPRLVNGYGNCGWYPTGGPPRQSGRIDPTAPMARQPLFAEGFASESYAEPTAPVPGARGVVQHPGAQVLVAQRPQRP